MKRLIIPILPILTLTITACSAASPLLPSQPQADPVSTKSVSPELASATRLDNQGAIIFEVTPTGVSINSSLWDAPRGGHHVEGKLIFPATQDSKSILEGATKLTLTIINVDAPTRIFEWKLK